jgi:hypothetical protein
MAGGTKNTKLSIAKSDIAMADKANFFLWPPASRLWSVLPNEPKLVASTCPYQRGKFAFGEQRRMQNKAKLPRFHPKNKDCKKTNPIWAFYAKTMKYFERIAIENTKQTQN